MRYSHLGIDLGKPGPYGTWQVAMMLECEARWPQEHAGSWLSKDGYSWIAADTARALECNSAACRGP